MLEVDKAIAFFKTKEVWFAEGPSEIKGYDEVRFYECPNSIRINGFSCVKFTTILIDLNQSIETIWKNMDKSSCRYAIKKAIKQEIEVRINQDYDAFMKLNRFFREKKGLPPSFLTREFMRNYGVLFTAKYGGEIICGQFYLKDEKHMRWLVGASVRLENEGKGNIVGISNRLLVWEAIKYAKAQGQEEFDLGGYFVGIDKTGQLDGINFFKRTFGGKLAVKYNYTRNYSRIFRLIFFIYSKSISFPQTLFILRKIISIPAYLVKASNV